MPIYRDHYTRGSEIKATARSKISSFTSGLLYGVFHFFTPVFCLPSEQLTDNIQNLLGGSFRCHTFHLLFCFAKFTRLCFYHPNSLRICSRSSRSGPLSGCMFFASFLIVRISIKNPLAECRSAIHHSQMNHITIL